MALKLKNDLNKYNCVDAELNYINSKFISLNDEEKKVTSAFFTEFKQTFVNEMKKANKLFENMYQTILHAGSYYDGLKIGKPDEYDLDLIFKLPVNYDEIKITSSKGKPGYVKIQLSEQEYLKLIKNQHWSDCYCVMADWFDKNKFFIPDKFRCWLQSVVQSTFNQNNFFANGLGVTFTTSGPAITLHLQKGNIKFSVDLVPVLKMDKRAPPPAICNLQDVTNSDGLSWYVVPKPIKNTSNNGANTEVNLHWRLAFHEHEKVLIAGSQRLKPALRLLKKFRDSQNFPKIASYYLKTICLWELKKQENKEIWISGSLSYVFVHLLKAFYESLKARQIKYYWQRENNLLSVVRTETIDNNCCTLKKIIDKIDSNPKSIPEYILSKAEYNLYTNYHVSNYEEIMETPYIDEAISEDVLLNISDSTNIAEIHNEVLDKSEFSQLKKTHILENENDEDLHYFKSLIPHVKQLNPKAKFLLRMKISELVYDHVYSNK